VNDADDDALVEILPYLHDLQIFPLLQEKFPYLFGPRSSACFDAIVITIVNVNERRQRATSTSDVNERRRERC
jgi:hypothetical protein